MKIKRNSFCNLGVFLILFLSFSRSFHNKLLGGNSKVIIVLVFAVLLIIAACSSIKLPGREQILWVLVLILALIGNQDIENGNRLAYTQIIIGTILIILLSGNRGWCETAIKNIKKMTIFLLVTGVFFLIFKNLLVSFIVPLFNMGESDNYYAENLMNQIQSGYMTGLTSHYSTMGIYMSIGFIFSLGKIFNNRDWIKSGDLFLPVCMLLGVLLTGKRSALLFPTLAGLIVYMLYFKPKDIKRRYTYFSYAILVLLCVGIIIMIMPGSSGTFLRFMEIFGSNDMQTITNKRYEMLWLPAIYLFLESPILGIGWGGFKYSFTRYYKYSANQNNTHNVYLQLLCERGIVGTIIVLSAIIFSLSMTLSCLRKWRKNIIVLNNNEVAILGISAAMQIYFMLYSLSGNPLYDITCYFPYIIAVCMSISVRNYIGTSREE